MLTYETSQFGNGLRPISTPEAQARALDTNHEPGSLAGLQHGWGPHHGG